jgi:metal-sulfur cluster biosynthetic enzyme
MSRASVTAPTADQVRAVLNGIVDPCSAAAGAPAGLDDMGLVREVEVETETGSAGAVVRVMLALTEPTCLMGIPFMATARERLEALPGVDRAEVSLASGFEWTPAELSTSYAARLERVRERRREMSAARARGARS